MITLTSWTVKSNLSGHTDVWVEGVTNLIATAVVDSSTPIDQAYFLITNLNGSVQTVYPTETTPGTWVYTGATNTPGDYMIALRFTNADGDRLQGFARYYSVKEHEAPTITYDVFRCDSNGDLDMNGGYLSVTVWASANPAELGLDSGVDLDGDFQQGNLTNGTQYIIGNGAIDPDTQYTLRFIVEDNAELSITETYEVPVVKRIINVKDGNTGIAFMKKATDDGVIGKPDSWIWEGVNDNFSKTNYESATGTSGSVSVKTWNITEAGVYLVCATGYQTTTGYSNSEKSMMATTIGAYHYDSNAQSLGSYTAKAPMTGGGDCCVSAMFQCAVGDSIELKMQQAAGGSGATLAQQTFYVRSSIIRLV